MASSVVAFVLIMTIGLMMLISMCMISPTTGINITSTTSNANPPNSFDDLDHYYSTRVMKGGKFLGTTGKLNVWKPTVLQAKEFSLAQVWVTSRTRVINSIEVGWHVYPSKYDGSTEPHFFVYWTSSGYRRTGCYNRECVGFEPATGSKIKVGTVLTPTSQMKGKQQEMQISILKEKDTGNWVLKYRYGDSEPMAVIGHWPPHIFTNNLKDYAEEIQWGGEVAVVKQKKAKKDKFKYPEMGSGVKATEGGSFIKNAYASRLKVKNFDGSISPFNLINYMQTEEECYSNQISFGHTETFPAFFFGGKCVKKISA